jgi:hypothetical protein
MKIISEGKHKGCVRGFRHISASWYGDSHEFGPNIVDEVLFGFYHVEGGTTGEMAVRWKTLSNRVTPQLQVFDDAWHALYEMNDVLARMARTDGDDIIPEDFCALLLACGFVDMTERTRGEKTWRERS